jgi:hypothetical protein
MPMTNAPKPEFPAEKIQHCCEAGYASASLVRVILRAAKEWDAREGAGDKMREALVRARAHLLVGAYAGPKLLAEIDAALTQSTAKDIR